MNIYDVVKFDGIGSDWLLYKYPENQYNNKSKLIVSPGQIAIIVHNGKIEKIVENGTHVLNSTFLPVLSKFQKMVFNDKNPYPIEIYFINTKIKLDFLWGTSDPIDLLDPIYKIKIALRARGQLGVKLEEYQYFYEKLVGTILNNRVITFDVIRNNFRGVINQKLRKVLTSHLLTNKISYFEIGMHIDTLQEKLESDLKDAFGEFGFKIVTFSIESIDCPESDLSKLNEIFHKKAEMDQLGDNNYRTIRGYDVMEAGAKGNGNASAFMGVGLGMQMGNQMQRSTIIPPQDNSSSKIDCPKCGASISSNSKFCPECGAKILTECPKCGAKVTPRQKFCPECGEKLYK
ncbi:MAG: SPFH domain-containing protein [Bacilli bacterium]|nr:SPFH domain-containing protein [Bacilli bacterium]